LSNERKGKPEQKYLRLSEKSSEKVSFKEASRNFIFIFLSIEGRLKIEKPFAHVQKVLI
jgi:hypothetical protein